MKAFQRIFRPGIAAWLCVLAVLIAPATAPVLAEPAGANPSPDDGPVPASMAPSYIAIGKNLYARMSLVRRTLDDLALDAPVRRQANALVDSCRASIESLLTKAKEGQLPLRSQVMALPDNLRQARSRLLAVIGPEESQLLSEKMQSLRGEARQDMAQLRIALEDLKTSTGTMTKCQSILAQGDASIEKLPDTQLDGEEYAADRQMMLRLLANIHDHLAGILTPAEQSQLGQPFAELAADRPTSQPSPAGSG